VRGTKEVMGQMMKEQRALWPPEKPPGKKITKERVEE